MIQVRKNVFSIIFQGVGGRRWQRGFTYFKLAVGGACRVFAYTVNWGKIDP